MKVKFNNLQKQWEQIKDDTIPEIDHLFEVSDFILGSAVKEFENDFSQYINTTYSVGVSNGTDALTLAAKSLLLKNNPLIIIPSNTFVATIMGIEEAYKDATFELIDCDEYFQIDINKLEDFLVKNRHKYSDILVVPVHLYGYCCNMDDLLSVCANYECKVLEDASQSHGTEFKKQKTGSFGHVSAFSLYPGKNLGAAGDAGIITTNDTKTYKLLLSLRNLGSSEKYIHHVKGFNNRLDTIQAIILKNKLRHLSSWNARRRYVANQYEEKINNDLVRLPKTPENCLPTHHIFPVLCDNRDNFEKFLKEHTIEYGIHYPIAIEEMEMYKHLSKNTKSNCLKYSKQLLSLPMHPFLQDEEIEYVCERINMFNG